MTKTVKEVAAALRAHRAASAKASADGTPGCIAFIAPKVEVTMSTCIGVFNAVIPVEADDGPGTAIMRFGEEISFVQHDNAYSKNKAERFVVSSERFHGSGVRTIAALRDVARDINAFCDAVELVWRGGEPKP